MTYIVKAGDSLWGILNKANVPQSQMDAAVEKVVAENDLKRSEADYDLVYIFPGQKLNLDNLNVQYIGKPEDLNDPSITVDDKKPATKEDVHNDLVDLMGKIKKQNGVCTAKDKAKLAKFVLDLNRLDIRDALPEVEYLLNVVGTLDARGKKGLLDFLGKLFGGQVTLNGKKVELDSKLLANSLTKQLLQENKELGKIYDELLKRFPHKYRKEVLDVIAVLVDDPIFVEKYKPTTEDLNTYLSGCNARLKMAIKKIMDQHIYELSKIYHNIPAPEVKAYVVEHEIEELKKSNDPLKEEKIRTKEAELGRYEKEVADKALSKVARNTDLEDAQKAQKLWEIVKDVNIEGAKKDVLEDIIRRTNDRVLWRLYALLNSADEKIFREVLSELALTVDNYKLDRMFEMLSSQARRQGKTTEYASFKSDVKDFLLSKTGNKKAFEILKRKGLISKIELLNFLATINDAEYKADQAAQIANASSDPLVKEKANSIIADSF